MKTLIKSLVSASAIFVLSGCGDSVFQGPPDKINLDINEGQTKSISVSGGQSGSSYTWSVVSGGQVLSISESSTGGDLTTLETESSTVYVTSTQVSEDEFLKINAVELTSAGDSTTHTFNISVINIEAYSQQLDADENNMVEVVIEKQSRDNTFVWEQISGPTLTIAENANVANVITPKVSSDSVAVVLIKETSTDGYYNETLLTINILDVPIQVQTISGSSGDYIKVKYPNPLDDSTYEWSVLYGEEATISGSGDTVDILLPDVEELAQTVIVAKQTDVNSIETSVRFEVDILPKKVNSLVFEFKTEEEGAIVVINGDVESEYIWTQITGPTVNLTETNTLRAVLDMPKVEEDSLATFLVKETDSKGEVTRTAVSIMITVTGNSGSSVMSMSFTSGDIYPKNTNIIPAVALADDGLALSAYQVKYTDGIGVNAVAKEINSDIAWKSDGTELDRVGAIESMAVDVADNQNGIIAYISKTDAKTSLSYIRYNDGFWSEPTSIISTEEYKMSGVSVSINDTGKAALSYIKYNVSGEVANYNVVTVSPSGSTYNKEVAVAGRLTRTAFENTVSAINARNSDDSITYVLTNNNVFEGKVLNVGAAVVFIDSTGTVYLTHKNVEVHSTVTIEDPTVGQGVDAVDLYEENTNVTLGFISQDKTTYTLKSSLVNGVSVTTNDIVASGSNIGFYANGVRSGKYAVVFDSENELGLTDSQISTYNVFSKSKWSTIKHTEHFDDKSFFDGKVSVNDAGDLAVTSKYEGVNGDEGHQITLFDAANGHEESSMFVDEMEGVDGEAVITTDAFGNVLFSYVEESEMLIQTYPKLDSPASRVTVEIDGAENILWNSNNKGELVLVHYSDVDSGYVHTKQQK
jgi:hypothetical protein